MKCEGCPSKPELVKVTETEPAYSREDDKLFRGFPQVINCTIAEVYHCTNCGRVSHVKKERTYIPAFPTEDNE